MSLHGPGGRLMLDLFHTLRELQAWGVHFVAQTGLHKDEQERQVAAPRL
jgi:hypothetical protein